MHCATRCTARVVGRLPNCNTHHHAADRSQSPQLLCSVATAGFGFHGSGRGGCQAQICRAPQAATRPLSLLLPTKQQRCVHLGTCNLRAHTQRQFLLQLAPLGICESPGVRHRFAAFVFMPTRLQRCVGEPVKLACSCLELTPGPGLWLDRSFNAATSRMQRLKFVPCPAVLHMCALPTVQLVDFPRLTALHGPQSRRAPARRSRKLGSIICSHTDTVAMLKMRVQAQVVSMGARALRLCNTVGHFRYGTLHRSASILQR